MEILKKAYEIGKSKEFFELDVAEMKLLVPGIKWLIPFKEKQLKRLQAKYEGQSDIYFKIEELNSDLKFLNHLITLLK
jgi:hypothetical protein